MALDFDQFVPKSEPATPDQGASLNFDQFVPDTPAAPANPNRFRYNAEAPKPQAVPIQTDGFSPTGEPGDPFANEDSKTKARRRGQQFMQGATEGVAAVPEAIGISETAGATAQKEGSAKLSKIQREHIAELSAVVDSPDSAPEMKTWAKAQIAALEEGVAKLDEAGFQKVTPARDRDIYKQGDVIRKGSEGIFGKPDERDKSFWANLASGAGNMTGVLAATAVTSALGQPEIGMGIAGAQMAAQSGTEGYKQAIAAGADEATALKSFEANGAIGAVSALPVFRALNMLPEALRVKAGNAFLNQVIHIGQSAGENAAINYATTVASNLVAQGLYDPNRSWSQGADESAVLGVVMGGGLGAAGAVISGAHGVEKVPEKGPNSAEIAALGEANKPVTPPAPTPATPEGVPAAAEVTPKVTPGVTEPNHTGVHVGETAPDVTLAATEAATSNKPSAPQAPTKPAPGSPPGALGEYVKQLAAFRKAQAEQAAPAPAAPVDTSTAPAPVPSDGAPVAEGPQVGGAPAAPPSAPPIGQAPMAPRAPLSKAGEALQGLDQAKAPVGPPTEMPASEAPIASQSPAKAASDALPPVQETVPPGETAPVATGGSASASKVTPEVTRPYTTVSRHDILMDAGLGTGELTAFTKKKLGDVTSLIRSIVRRDTGLPLERMTPEERKAAVSKAWADINTAKEAQATAAAAPRPPKAEAAIKASKAKEAAPEVSEAEKAKRAALIEEYNQKLRAEAQAKPEVAPAPEAGKPRVLKAVDEASLAKEAENKAAADEIDAKKAAQLKEAETKATDAQEQVASGVSQKDEPTEVENHAGATERARRTANKSAADEIVNASKVDPIENDYERADAKGIAARAKTLARVRDMVAQMKEKLTPTKEGEHLFGRIKPSKDADLAPNASQMVLWEARRLAGLKNPTRKNITDFRSAEALLKSGMVKEYLEGRGIAGDTAKGAKATQTNDEGEKSSATESMPSEARTPEQNLEARQEGTDEEQAHANEAVADEPTQKPIEPEARKFTSESNPGYTVGAKKEGEVKVETKKKRVAPSPADRAKLLSKAKEVTPEEAAKAATDKGKFETSENIVKSSPIPGWDVAGDKGSNFTPIRSNFGDNKYVAALRKLLSTLDVDPNLKKFATDFDTFKNMAARLRDVHFEDAKRGDRHHLANGETRDKKITKTIIDRMAEVMGDVPVYVIRDEIMDSVGTDVGAFYSPTFDHIVMRESAFKDPNRFIHDLVHEGAHAALWQAVRKNPEARRQLAQMAAAVNNDFHSRGEQKPYSLTNLDEFMSELISNPNTQFMLHDMMMPDEAFTDIGVPAPKGKLRNAWEYVKALVADTLGFHPDDRQIYRRAINVIDTLLSQAKDAREEWNNLPDNAAKEKWQNEQESKFQDWRMQRNSDDMYDYERTRYEDLGMTTKNNYPPSMLANKRDTNVDALVKEGLKPKDAHAAAKVIREQFPDGISHEDLAAVAQAYRDTKAQKEKAVFTQLVDGGVPQKDAIEINAYIKAELGKSIDPATVPLLIEDILKDYQATSESNTYPPGGGAQPPYKEPPSPGMGPGDPKQPAMVPFKGKAESRLKAVSRRLALKNMTLDFLRQKYSKMFGGTDGPLDRWVKSQQKRDEIRQQYAANLQRVAIDFENFQKAHPEEAAEIAYLAGEASRLNVKLGDGADNSHLGKKAAKGLQGKAKLDELNARYNSKLSDAGREAYQKFTSEYRDAHNGNTTALAYNIIKALNDKRPDGSKLSNSDVMHLLDKVTEGRLTDADAHLVDDKTVFHALQRATELKLIKGDYFPADRNGEHVVTTREAVDNPNWTSVPTKLGKNKTGSVPVKTEVVDSQWKQGDKGSPYPDTIQVTVDPDVRGSRTAALTALREHAANHELTLQGISTLYKDRKTGKLVSKGDQMVDRDYDVVYQAKFQTNGTHFFESHKKASAFQKESTSPFTSEVMAKGDFSASNPIQGSQLAAIVNHIHPNDSKVKDPALRQQMINMVEQAVIAQTRGNRIQKHNLKRNNVIGASKDLARAAFKYADAAANHHAMLQTAPEAREAMQEMAKVEEASHGGAGAAEMTDLMNEVRAREASLVTPKTSPQALRDIATMSYFYRLISPMFSVMNAMQPSGTTWPILAGRYGMIDAGKAMASAYAKVGLKDSVGAGLANTGRAAAGVFKNAIDTTDLMGSLRKNAGKEYGPLFDELESRSLMGSDTGLEVAGPAGRGRGAFGRGMHNVDRVARQMPNAVEVVNRATTAIATYDLARKAGKSQKEAIEEAYNTTSNTQGDYRGSNSPNWMKTKGLGWALQFKKFSQLHGQLFSDMVHRSLADASPAERIVARKQLAHYIGTQAMVAGVLGLPIATELLKIGFVTLGMLGVGDGWDEEEYKYRKAVESTFGKTMGSIINNGLLSTVTGLDFGSRLSLSDMLMGRSPPSNDSTGLMSWVGNTIVGAPGGMVGDWVDGVHGLTNAQNADDVEKSMAKLLPVKMISDSVKAVRNYQNGDVGVGGAIGNAFGVRTLKQSEDGRDHAHSKRVSEQKKADEKVLKNALRNALDRGDNAAWSKAVSNVREYNKQLHKTDHKARGIDIGQEHKWWARDKRTQTNAAP